MRVIEKIEVSKLKYGCVVVTQNFLFNYSLFKIILNPSKKVEFSSENQKDMSVDGNSRSLKFGRGSYRVPKSANLTFGVSKVPKYYVLSCRITLKFSVQ